MVLNPPSFNLIIVGLGDTSSGWASVMDDEFVPYLPHVRFVLPTAPVGPVSLNNGFRMTRYDLVRFYLKNRQGFVESVITFEYFPNCR